MRWYERPTEIDNFWRDNIDNIKGYEKQFDWEACEITYIINFISKDTKPVIFKYSFDGVKP